MASQTSALPDGSTLTKPAYTDSADIAVINTNMDKIVSNINAENQALSALTTKTTISDCNTYNAEGEGRIVDSTANRPFNYGVLKNLIYSLSGYRAQLAVSVSSQAYAYRTSNDGGSTWSSWKEVALKSEAIKTQKVSGYIRFDDPSTNIGIGINPTNNRMFVQDSDGTIKYFNLTAMT